MTDKLRQAAEMALKALEDMNCGWKYIRESHGDLYGVGWDRAQEKADEAIEALRQALEQPEQKPVAWMSDSPTKGNGKQLHWTKAEAWRWSSNITPLYTAPPQREWQGLTDEEVSAAVDDCDVYFDDEFLVEFARRIEAKLKEKNHD